jgi:hypothetical protein
MDLKPNLDVIDFSGGITMDLDKIFCKSNLIMMLKYKLNNFPDKYSVSTFITPHRPS